MKRKSLIMVLPFLFCGNITAQTDTVGICDRVANYVYSNPWMDSYNAKCDGNCTMTAVAWDVLSFTPAIVSKRCITDTTLQVIGIAAPVVISSTGIGHIDSGHPTLDTSMANRDPEYFYLYNSTDSGIIFLGRARWDTLPPQHKMQVHAMPQFSQMYFGSVWDTSTYYVDVREAYFPKAIPVSDTFYVGGSMFNNYMSSVNNYYAHPRTYYLRWQTQTSYTGCSFGYCGADYNDLVRYFCDENSPQQMENTWRVNPYIWQGFGCIFPIFNTSSGSADTTTVIPDTCHTPASLRVLHIENNSVSLTWNDNGNYLWDVYVVREGEPADSATNKTVYTNFATFTDLDTARWYVAQVRAVCGSNNRSEWSDSVQFYVPGNAGQGTEAVETPEDSYTMLMPNPASGTVTVMSSFQLQKVEIYSMDGRRLMQQKAVGIATTVDIGALPSGTYFVRIGTNHGTAFKRLVVK